MTSTGRAGPAPATVTRQGPCPGHPTTHLTLISTLTYWIFLTGITTLYFIHNLANIKLCVSDTSNQALPALHPLSTTILVFLFTMSGIMDIMDTINNLFILPISSLLPTSTTTTHPRFKEQEPCRIISAPGPCPTTTTPGPCLVTTLVGMLLSRLLIIRDLDMLLSHGVLEHPGLVSNHPPETPPPQHSLCGTLSMTGWGQGPLQTAVALST